jgi:hypothetical protein
MTRCPANVPASSLSDRPAARARSSGGRAAGSGHTGRGRGRPAAPPGLPGEATAVGPLWQGHGLVFTDKIGRQLSDVSAKNRFRKVLEMVDGIEPEEWAPSELRHTFVSVLDSADVPSAYEVVGGT